MDENKKILLIGGIPSFLGSNNYGGVSHVVWNLAKNLKKLNVNISIAAIGRYFKTYQRVDDIDIHGIGFSFKALFKTFKLLLNIRFRKLPLNTRHFLKLIYALYFLNYINNKVSFDIIHVHHVINQIPLALSYIRSDVKIVATIHSYTTLIKESEVELNNIKYQLKHLDHITHVSHQLKETAAQKGIYWECSDSIIYNGIRFNDKHKPTNVDKKKNSLCFIGNISKIKGIDILIDGLNKLPGDNYRLYIAGKGPYEKKLSSVPNDNIEVLGWLNENQIYELLLSTQLLVNPSRSESFGLIYLEALFAGIPVIGYEPIIKELKEHLNLSESLKNWLIEFDYKKENSKILAEKIQKGLNIIYSDSYSKDMNRMKDLIVKNFKWERIASQYIELYRQIQK